MALNIGKGWHNESTRHSLARKGVKTGKKSNPVRLNKPVYKTKTGIQIINNKVIIKAQNTEPIEVTKSEYERQRRNHKGLSEKDWNSLVLYSVKKRGKFSGGGLLIDVFTPSFSRIQQKR